MDSEGLYYIHNKTNVKIIFWKNQDKQKAFMLGFNTPIFDSTGIALVIEQGVLSGSKTILLTELMW